MISSLFWDVKKCRLIYLPTFRSHLPVPSSRVVQQALFLNCSTVKDRNGRLYWNIGKKPPIYILPLSQDNGRIAMCRENNDLQTIYFFNSHIIHIRPTLSASYWIQNSHFFFCEVSYCNEVSVSIITSHKLRPSISYKYLPVLVFSGVNDNSILKIIFRGTIIPDKIALQLLCHKFVKKTQWTPKTWCVKTYSTFFSASALYYMMAWYGASTKIHIVFYYYELHKF